MSEPEDDFLFELSKDGVKSDWRRGAKGVWTVELPNGNRGEVVCQDDIWRATVTLGGKSKKSGRFKLFEKCLDWAERLLYPPRTAWDRIRSV